MDNGRDDPTLKDLILYVPSIMFKRADTIGDQFIESEYKGENCKDLCKIKENCLDYRFLPK